MTFRTISILLAACALAACAGPGPRGPRDLEPVANPSAVIATELAFARAAREDGQWTAFREYAADDAVMFVPEPVSAQEWLKRRQDPPQAVEWQPYQVWSSCDGSLAVTKGPWQRADGSVGYFTTVWKRQQNGEYRWVLDQGDSLPQPLAAPEMIGAVVADCDAGDTIANRVLARSGGKSRDGTLSYEWETTPGGGRELTVSMIRDGDLVDVLDISVAGSEG